MLQPQDIYNSSVKNIVIKSQMRFFTAVLCYSTQQIHRFVSATSLSNMYLVLLILVKMLRDSQPILSSPPENLFLQHFSCLLCFPKEMGRKTATFCLDFPSLSDLKVIFLDVCFLFLSNFLSKYKSATERCFKNLYQINGNL